MKMRGDRCAECAEFKRHAALTRETSRDFREGLKQDESNGIWRHYVLFDIRHKYHVMNKTFTRNIWEILESKFLAKSIKNRLHLKRRLYRFPLKKGISIGEHMNNYMRLLVDLPYMDDVTKNKDKALILFSSLPDEECETFVLTLINGKTHLAAVMYQLLL